MTQHEIKSAMYPYSKGYYRIIKEGQDDIAYSDNVIVKLFIYLPANSDGLLHPDICLEHRLSICDIPLHNLWGTTIDSMPDYRFYYKVFYGISWKVLFEQAEDYAKRVLEILENILHNRQQILLNAENESL